MVDMPAKNNVYQAMSNKQGNRPKARGANQKTTMEQERILDYASAYRAVAAVLRSRHIKCQEPDAVATHWLMSGLKKVPYWDIKWDELARICLSCLEDGATAANLARERHNQELQVTFDFGDIPFPPPSVPVFTFIDLFAGIGGFRQAMQSLEGKCLFSCEWDIHAQKTYLANYGEMPYGDIRNINADTIPDHDVLCAGFPCQPFSLAGVSKKNSLGRKHGFEDETQGTLFFDIARIIKAKKPKAFFLENVKNLLSHDNGCTFETIRRTLEDELGYVVNWRIVDASRWVPQHRERLFIVGFHPKHAKGITKSLIDIPVSPSGKYRYPKLSEIILKEVDRRFTLGPGTWDTLRRHKAHHAAKGQGFGYGLHLLPIKDDEITRTISARYHKDGAEILIGNGDARPRRLTVEEAMQLQGYDPKRFRMPVSDTQAYRQIGNSVAVPAIRETASMLVRLLIKGAR